MSNRPIVRSKKSKPNNQSKYLWYGLGAALVILAVVAFLVSRSAASPFVLTTADEATTVFLRTEKVVPYGFTYNGASPAQLTRILPQIQLYQGQSLVTDVERVQITIDGEVIDLEDGDFPEGRSLELQPGDTFTIEVVYLGQDLGWNRIYGFRIGYDVNGRSLDGTITLDDDYYIFVE